MDCRVDLALEIVDRLHARSDVASPGLRDLESCQQLSALDSEEVGDRQGFAKLISVEWTRFLSADLCLTR